jgi:hypothetical protein
MGARSCVALHGAHPRLPAVSIALAALWTLAVVAPSTEVAGQTRALASRAPRSQAKGAGGASGAPDAGAALPAPVGLPPSSAADGGFVETKTLDGGTQVFKFKELDIEGRLKSPQLVYFLRRVRAEFAAGDLGHRSFLPEMSETRKEASF